MNDNLDFARRAADLLWEKQSATLAGSPTGTRFLTVTSHTGPSWTSVALRASGHYELYPVPEQPLDLNPTRLDLEAWSWMERLSARTGDPRWRQRVDAMAADFAVYGFDPRSGLGYLGQEAQFDVVRLGPAGTGAYTMPKFKPGWNLPLETLWHHAAPQMDRMFRAAYYGLVTRPETLDYNRFCFYGTDDAGRRPFMDFNSRHVAFAQTGAFLIHWWVFHWLQTRQEQSLAWAQAMADKWRAVQHPDTGLVPHWFGSDDPNDTCQPPRPFCNAHDSWTALVYLEAAQLLRQRTEAAAAGLGRQLQQMGQRLAAGLARFGYDAQQRHFPQWLRVTTGEVASDVIYYAFPTAAQKEEAIRRDPRLEVVSVFAGDGLYAAGPWSYGSGSFIPFHIARAAELTGDAHILSRARQMAGHIMEAAAGLRGARTTTGQWTYDAGAGFVRLMLALRRATGEARYRDQAAALLARELTALNELPAESAPEWWRYPCRNGLMSALLEWE
ncbi:MAG: hypothetical protein HYV36_03500 [Lentisphaerae bacterium]|nr:hypothetical protein [Lentisphaerota bacterium]